MDYVKKLLKSLPVGCLDGANVRIRTVGLLITSELLCHLSYIGYSVLYFAVCKTMCIFARIRYYASWEYSSTSPMENQKK